MEITASKITTIDDAHAAIEATMYDGFEAKCTLDQLYMWEHSPSRTQMFWVIMKDIPTKVSVHMVRHSAVGQQHFVKTNRPDRGGAGDDEVTRNTVVNHRMLLNAQHFIDMSRKRLCYQAMKETREVMGLIRREIRVVDPDLGRYMVPNCVYRGGYCPEPRACGNYKVKRYDPLEIFSAMIRKELK